MYYRLIGHKCTVCTLATSAVRRVAQLQVIIKKKCKLAPPTLQTMVPANDSLKNSDVSSTRNSKTLMPVSGNLMKRLIF